MSAKTEPHRTTTLKVAEPTTGQRLDVFLAGHVSGVSRSQVQALIKAGQVTENNHTISEPKHRVKLGSIITLTQHPPRAAVPRGQTMDLVIVHEDAALIVIDKPAGLVVHPAAGHADGTLVNALVAHCGDSLSGIGGERRPGIVHRLDKDTTGLMVVAKSDVAHRGLCAQFASHGADGRMQRAYLAVVWGVPERRQGRIAAALARKSTDRTRMAVVRDESGRHAVTHYAVLETFAGHDGAPAASLVQCELETGRTHQIRVHMTYLGHPLLGDATYGRGFAASAAKLGEAARAALVALDRQALHAAVLGFEHPVTGRALRFESPPPPDLALLLAALRPASARAAPTAGKPATAPVRRARP